MLNVRKIWENSNIKDDWPALARSVRFDEPMSKHTSFKIGGPADLFASPPDAESLAALISFLHEREVPVSVVGGGSNLLVADRGIRGAVITLESLSSIEEGLGEDAGSGEGRGSGMAAPGAPCPPSSVPLAPSADPPIANSGCAFVTAGAGASMEALTEWCAERGFSGLERFAGLPGSVGGAAFMNARCYDRSVSDVFFKARVLYFAPSGYTLLSVPRRAEEWDYKRSPFQARVSADPVAFLPGDRLLCGVTFALGRGDPAAMAAEMAGYVADREAKGHFRFPSAGSMFKNDRAFGKPSGAIIDETGLKGFRIGDAQVAEWHGNIVINAGNATAADVRALVDEIGKRVFERTGFRLEPEVLMAGEW